MFCGEEEWRGEGEAGLHRQMAHTNGVIFIVSDLNNCLFTVMQQRDNIILSMRKCCLNRVTN